MQAVSLVIPKVTKTYLKTRLYGKGNDDGHGIDGTLHHNQGSHVLVFFYLSGNIGCGQQQPVNNASKNQQQYNAESSINEKASHVG
jgi:hypothetical protein